MPNPPYERGEVRFRERHAQAINYKGLCYGQITPTDLDGLIDFGNRAFVLLEFKTREAPFLDGQRKALMRCVDALAQWRRAILIMVRHDVPAFLDIPAAEQQVDTCYLGKGRWEPNVRGETVRDRIDRFLVEEDMPEYLRDADNSSVSFDDSW